MFRVQRYQATSPTPLFLPELNPETPTLEEAEIEVNEQNPEAVLEEAVEDFSPPCTYIPDVTALNNMLAIADMPTPAVHKSFGIVT